MEKTEKVRQRGKVASVTSEIFFGMLAQYDRLNSNLDSQWNGEKKMKIDTETP